MALTDAQLERYARRIVLKEIGGAGQARLLERACRHHRRRRDWLPGRRLSGGGGGWNAADHRPPTRSRSPISSAGSCSGRTISANPRLKRRATPRGASTRIATLSRSTSA